MHLLGCYEFWKENQDSLISVIGASAYYRIIDKLAECVLTAVDAYKASCLSKSQSSAEGGDLPKA